MFQSAGTPIVEDCHRRRGRPQWSAPPCSWSIDASNVALPERLLRNAGITAVHGLTDARGVVSHCLELRPDLVLLDLHMPHMDGCTVLAALHDAMPADAFLPVVVLTADSSATARNDALDAGAKDS
jgi:putative two-component system response regulator